jgi:hypothetical protein
MSACPVWLTNDGLSVQHIHAVMPAQRVVKELIARL